MYAFADLRTLARQGLLSAAEEKLLTLPVCMPDVLAVVQTNREVLRTHLPNTVDLYDASLASLSAAMQRQAVDAETGEVVQHSAQLVAFDDEKSASELVYGIAVNTARRRITVGFRGSVTLQDFQTDASASMVRVPTPVPGGTPAVMGIHHGFNDYLLGVQRREVEATHKCATILTRVVQLLEDSYPGYALYVTGHSLGGALATLFSLYAAADVRITSPVTCISVASPKVGNLAFRRIVQGLEQQGALRCLRIANYKDLVTLLPDRGTWSCFVIMCCQSIVYRHVGIELKLYHGNKAYALTKADDSRSYLGIFLRDWKKQVKHAFAVILTLPMILFCCCRRNQFLKFHACQEYMQRLLAHEKPLSETYLNRVYQQADTLGDD